MESLKEVWRISQYLFFWGGGGHTYSYIECPSHIPSTQKAGEKGEHKMTRPFAPSHPPPPQYISSTFRITTMARPNLGNLLSLLALQRPFGFDRTVLYINSRKHPGLAWIVYSSFKIKKICEFLLSFFDLVGLFLFIIILMMMLIRSNCHIMFIMYYQGVGAGCKISRKLPYKWKGGFTFSGAFWSEHKNRLWRGGGGRIFVCIIKVAS